jgi:hypothetical protein
VFRPPILLRIFADFFGTAASSTRSKGEDLVRGIKSVRPGVAVLDIPSNIALIWTQRADVDVAGTSTTP